MKLVLFRHGERENSGSSNPPLSQRGRLQAEQLAGLVRQQKLPQPQRLLCSPRLRTQMTLGPLSQELAMSTQIVAELDERMSGEPPELFQKRVRNFLFQQNQPVASGASYLCTHLDWLEAAMFEIPCDTDLSQDRYLSSWQPAHCMVFELGEDLWHLEKMETISP